MTTGLVYLDTETTGLDADRHELLDVAWLDLRGLQADQSVARAMVSSLQPMHTLKNADTTALRVNRYYERYTRPGVVGLEVVRRRLLPILDGATIVAANPAFDAAFLERLLGSRPWHHRLFDIEAYAAGVMDWDELRGLSAIRDALAEMGYDLPTQEHDAAGDVWLLYSVHQALREIRSQS